MKTGVIVAAAFVLAAQGASAGELQNLPRHTTPGEAPPTRASETGAQDGKFSQGAVDRELLAARTWLQLSLIDYDSAKFQGVQVVLVSPDRRNRRHVVLAVCGLVNSRNRMGGYTGYQPFYFGSGLPAYMKAAVSPSAYDLCGPANRVSTADYSERLSPGYRPQVAQ